MAFARGTYGIEYNPRQREDEPSGLGWVFALVALVALVSLIFTWVSHYRSSRAEAELVVSAESLAAEPSPATNAVVVPPAAAVVASGVEKRPHQLQVLLMRREEAVKSRNLELEASTIESIRQLPGSPAADLDDALARRLGTINLVRLWGKRNRQWVKEVEVKRGDSASRIAFEHGSTLAALQKLNGGSLDRLVAGKKIFVLDHPHFQLVVHRRLQTADLTLEDRFFKRYDLTQTVRPAVGRYEVGESFRSFLKATPLEFKASDRTELDTLLPRGTPVLISEM